MGAKGKKQVKDPRVKARVLVQAEVSTDEAAAARYDCSARSIQRWRAELETDIDLARAYRRLMAAVEDSFLTEAVKTYTALAERLRALAPDITEPRDVIAGMERIGDTLVQARALGRKPIQDDEDDGEPEVDREGPPTRADGPRAQSDRNA